MLIFSLISMDPSAFVYIQVEREIGKKVRAPSDLYIYLCLSEQYMLCGKFMIKQHKTIVSLYNSHFTLSFTSLNSSKLMKSSSSLSASCIVRCTIEFSYTQCHMEQQPNPTAVSICQIYIYNIHNSNLFSGYVDANQRTQDLQCAQEDRMTRGEEGRRRRKGERRGGQSAHIYTPTMVVACAAMKVCPQHTCTYHSMPASHYYVFNINHKIQCGRRNLNNGSLHSHF